MHQILENENNIHSQKSFNFVKCHGNQSVHPTSLQIGKDGIILQEVWLCMLQNFEILTYL